jgi:hypothetical protein
VSGADDDRQYAEWCAFLGWPLFWEKEEQVTDWEVEPLFPSGRQTNLYARAKVGKSLLLLDVATARATGGSLLGQPPRPAVHVLYFDFEMSADDLRERLEALGYGPESDLSRLHYDQAGDLPPLDTPLGGAVITATCQRFAASMVVVDTMARAVHGEENSSDTYRNFQQHTAGPLRSLGVTLVCADHSGKDSRQGQRGSSAKEDGADVVFNLSAAGDSLVLRRTHSRVPWVARDVTLRREEEPVLRHVLAPVAYPDGTVECAELLDDLGVSLDASRRACAAALKTAGQGRRNEVVQAAIKYRRRPR